MTPNADTARWLSRSDYRDIAAVLGAAFACFAVSGGLFYSAQSVQVALVVGAVAGLAASTRTRAALAAIVGGAVASAILPAYHLGILPLVDALPGFATILLGAAVVAFGVRALIGAWRAGAMWVLAAVLLLIIVNAWVTANAVTKLPVYEGSSIVDWLGSRPETGTDMGDDDFYRLVVDRMREGTPYYEAWRVSYHDVTRWGGDPGSVLAYRLPTTYWVAAFLDTPGRIIGGALVLCTIATLAAFALASQVVRMPLAIAGAAAVAAYTLFGATKTPILYAETWALPFVLVSLAAYVASVGSKRWLLWASVGAGAALVAMLFRELAIFVPVAGLVSTKWAPRAERRARIGLWAGAIGLFAIAYGLHWAAASGGVSGTTSSQAWLRGGASEIYVALQYAVLYIGEKAGSALPWTLAAIVGVAFVRPRERRAFAVVAIGIPLLSLLFIGNGALDNEGIRANYWGYMIVPLLLASAPWALALLPGVGRNVHHAPAPATEERPRVKRMADGDG